MQNQKIINTVVAEAISKSNSFNMLVNNLIVLENEFKAVSQFINEANEEEQIIIGFAISSRIESFLRRELDQKLTVELINLDSLTFRISLRLESTVVWHNILNFSILPRFEYSFGNEIMETSIDAESYIKELSAEMEGLKEQFKLLTTKSVMGEFKAKWFSILQPKKKDQYKYEIERLNLKIEEVRAEYAEISMLYNRDSQFKNEIDSFMREIKTLFSHAKQANISFEQN